MQNKNHTRTFWVRFSFWLKKLWRKITKPFLVTDSIEEANRAIVENSLQGLAIYQKGRIVFANPAYAQTLGYSVDEIYRMDAEQVANLIFVEDRQLLNMRMQAALSGDEVAPRYETRVVRKDGSQRWLDVSMSVISYQNQIAILVAHVDISDRKLMETEQARLIWELEAKNAELERFTYTVSHDLKSPLITIRGFLGFLEKDIAINNVARLKADVQRIYEATEKMQRLLNDLLMLSRVGRVTNPPEKVSFVSIAKEAADLAGGQIRARGVAVKISREMPEVYVDRQRIVEVVQNLLDNAVKFMENQPAPRIEIGCQGSENGDPILYVRDNGIGIDPQYYERIFGLFNKLNPDTDGTGIGLALVKRIVEFHNGHIWVESQQGQGASFYFTLPGVKKG
jgi:PAS domain S-box-containing protein